MSEINYGNSFNEWANITEIYQICPQCKSDTLYYSSFWEMHKCSKCDFMDWDKKRDFKYYRRTIIGD